MLNSNISSSKFVICLIGIVLLALGLRMFRLGTLPSILNPDEAAIGYNAYLLAETGKDEWGRDWPVTLQSFGDYKLVGYPTLVVALFSVFAPTEFMIRLPAALAGVLLVLVGLSWSKWLRQALSIQLFVAVLFAITPIFFFYSRMAFESLVALVFLVCSLGILLRRQTGWPRILFDLGGSILFAAACLTYNTPLLLLPFIIFSVVWWRGVLHVRTWILPVILLLCIGGLSFSALSTATAQKTAITIFSDARERELANTFTQRVPTLLESIATPSTYFVVRIIENTIKTFGLSFLVLRGGAHPWHSLPYWGHMYGVEYVLFLIGFLVVSLQAGLQFLRKKITFAFQPLADAANGPQILTLFFAVAGMAPAVVTVDAPHATRSLLFFFCAVLLAGEGFAYGITILKQKRFANNLLSIAFVALVSFSLSVSATRYVQTYFSWFPTHHPKQLPVGFDTAIRTAALVYPQQEIAVVDEHGTLYVYASWYLHMPATEFFATIHKQLPSPIGFRYGERVGQFHFIASSADRTTEVAIVQYNGQEWSISQ